MEKVIPRPTMPAIFLETIERVTRELPGAFAVCAEHLDRDARLAWNDDAVFPAASVIKIAVALEVMASLDLSQRLDVREEDKVIGSGVLAGMRPGRLPAGDLLYLSMAISDNTAANVLIDRVGVAAINARLASLGLTTTRLTGKLISERGEFSPTTAAELVILLRHVSSHEGLMALLERTQTASTIGRGLPDERFPGVGPTPPDIALAYKTGSIVGVVAEAGIVRTPRATYAIALLSKDSGDLRPNHTNIARVQLGEVSRAVYATFAS
jgi:beta-lactamase class A